MHVVQKRMKKGAFSLTKVASQLVLSCRIFSQGTDLENSK